MKLNNSKLLINESPLTVLPSLVSLVGLERAIILQQVHYACQQKNSGKEIDGVRYVWNTYEEWREVFPFWEAKTIQYHFLKLEKEGYLISIQAQKSDWNRTKFYCINYALLESKFDDRTSNALDHRESNELDDRASASLDVHKGTKTSSKTSSKREDGSAPPVETADEAKTPEPETISPSPLLNSENRSLPPRVRRLSTDEAADLMDAAPTFAEREPSEPEKIYIETFGVNVFLSPVQSQALADTTNFQPAQFRQTCQKWKLDGNRATSIGSLLDRYKNDLTYQKPIPQTTGILEHSRQTSKFYH